MAKAAATSIWIRVSPESMKAIRQVAKKFRLSHVNTVAIMAAKFATMSEMEQIKFIISGDRGQKK